MRTMKSSIALAIVSSLFLNACMGSHVIVKHAPTAGQHIRVAVLPFKDAPGAPGSGEMAAQAMTTYLLDLPAYEIIERGAIDQIIKEQNFSTTGAIAPETAASLGKLLGADALVVGSVAQFQRRNKLIFPPARATVNARLVRTNSGTVDWSGTYTVGWHPVKWAFCVFWPLGILLTITSPSAEDRMNKAVRGIARNVASQNKEQSGFSNR